MRVMGIILLCSIATANASGQPAMTRSEVQAKLMDEMGEQCEFMPLGTYKLDLRNPVLKNQVLNHERVGTIIVNILNTPAGTKISDLINTSVNLDVMVKVEVSRTAPSEWFCSIGQGRGLNAGQLTLKEIVRFEKVQGQSDGIPTDMYYVQAQVAYDPTAIAVRLYPPPRLSTDRKIQVLYRYDFFKKDWRVSAKQIVNLSDQFTDILSRLKN